MRCPKTPSSATAEAGVLAFVRAGVARRPRPRAPAALVLVPKAAHTPVTRDKSATSYSAGLSLGRPRPCTSPSPLTSNSPTHQDFPAIQPSAQCGFRLRVSAMRGLGEFVGRLCLPSECPLREHYRRRVSGADAGAFDVLRYVLLVAGACPPRNSTRACGTWRRPPSVRPGNHSAPSDQRSAHDLSPTRRAPRGPLRRRP